MERYPELGADLEQFGKICGDIQLCQILLKGSKTPPISIEVAIDTIVKILEDPTGPLACGLKLNSAVQKLWVELAARLQVDIDSQGVKNLETKAKRLVESYPEVIRATVKFVTKKRTPAEHTSMMDGLSVCRCDYSNPLEYAKMHDSFHRGSRDLLPGKWSFVYSAIGSLTGMMTLSLNGLTRGRYRKAKPGIPARNQAWPQDRDDLLPYGFADSVDGLDLWADHQYYGYLILNFAGAIVHCEPAFTGEIMSRGPNFTLGVHRQAQHLTTILDKYDIAMQFPARLQESNEAWFSEPLTYIFGFTSSLKLGGVDRYKKMLVTGGKALLRPVLVRALVTLSLPNTQSRYMEQFSYVNSLLAYINERPQDALWSVTTLQAPINEYFYILRNACLGGCMNIGCRTPDAEPKKCANCEMIKYCGKKCQAEAWNHPTHPHKGLCRKIKSLKEQLGPP
ncbi:hypothetical protein DFP72DRAFT_152118 [Ephemerocybe angulata]|uniref:MYND-type domain-containing protein n=1 Tax=Ephemerocybe angulata TaxID=980116 RepID=A0A8H6H9P5_9AGAR|nr:hypothetical protein DFP72DRAFT_152118 [Tulosesus angulatus]